MIDQALASVAAGALISGLALVPVLMWQYHRYGAPSVRRLLGLGMVLVYASAVVAYTIFPLPAQMSAAYCADHGRPVLLDPLAHFRMLPEELAGLTPWEVLGSPLLTHMLLNVALFVPLGVLGVRWAHWSATRTVLTGLGLSLLVEATQYTGNWFLFPCPYRLADVNDLMTNTLGAALGVGLAVLLPRVFEDPRELARGRGLPRPVTRARRWAAMLIDGWVLGSALLLTWLVVFVGASLVVGEREIPHQSVEQVLSLTRSAFLVVATLVAVVPTLRRGHASVGQRIVHLRPRALPGTRTPSWFTPGLVRGLAAVAVFSAAPTLVLAGLLWLAADAAYVVRDPRGLAGLVTGHEMADARA